MKIRLTVTLVLSTALLFVITTCSVDRSEMKSYSPAPSAYGILAEKSLDLMAGLDPETWGTMLSDSVVYYFPDGDEKTCTKLVGKTAFLTWWKNYISTSGIKSMSIENGSYMPVYIENQERTADLPGTQVIAYFSNKMIYESGAVSVKMNFIIHFDKKKMIDGYYTYYDMTPIVRMQNDTGLLKNITLNI